MTITIRSRSTYARYSWYGNFVRYFSNIDADQPKHRSPIRSPHWWGVVALRSGGPRGSGGGSQHFHREIVPNWKGTGVSGARSPGQCRVNQQVLLFHAPVAGDLRVHPPRLSRPTICAPRSRTATTCSAN